ncbi:MAG: fumarylacetoacetate hydrolase family protein [Bacillota bacterium]
MKFVRFEHKGKTSFGLLEDNGVKVIKGNLFGEYHITDNKLPIGAVRLLAPCKPSKIVAVGLNYIDHIREMGHEMPGYPMIFIKPSSAIIGPEDEIILPEMSQRVDYEGEMALIIGKTARNVKPDYAYDYILGAACFNDVTARDLQKADGQWTRAKSFDTFAPLGPCIAAGLNYDNLDIELILNNEVKQKSNTSNFVFKVKDIISFISSIMTLYPGDVIATGTTSGIGKLSHGDTVEVVIKDIGRLRNTVK